MPPCPPASPLTPDTVHLWVVEVGPGTPHAAARLAAASDLERERAARFCQERDGERYLVTHGALRLILAGYLGCQPADLEFAIHPWGKPWLRGSALEFNLSHSGALALVGVTLGRQVGVDIEQIRPLADLMALAARVCSVQERAALEALPAPSREVTFLRLWTQKEAWAKMTGEGIQALSPETPRSGPGDHLVVSLEDVPGYAASIAAAGSGWRIVRAT